jgi:hypothetical protein
LSTHAEYWICSCMCGTGKAISNSLKKKKADEKKTEEFEDEENGVEGKYRELCMTYGRLESEKGDVYRSIIDRRFLLQSAPLIYCIDMKISAAYYGKCKREAFIITYLLTAYLNVQLGQRD